MSTLYTFNKQQFNADVSFNSKLHVDGSSAALGTNIARIVQGDGSYNSVTDAFQDPFSITTAISDPSNLTIGMGVDTTSKVGYINVAQSGSLRPLFLNCSRESAPVIALGNVGIGTTNPGNKLEIAGYGADNSRIVINDTSVGTNFKKWGFGPYSGNLYGFIMNDDNTNNNNWLTVYRAENGTSINSVTFPNGNVGIGTTDPGAKLHVVGAARIRGNANDDHLQVINNGGNGNSYLYFNYLGDTGYYSSDNGSTWYAKSNGNGFFNGNVGIGTTTPAYKLDVNGTVRATEFLNHGAENRRSQITDGTFYTYWYNYYGKIYQFENITTYLSYGNNGRYGCHQFWAGDFNTDNQSRKCVSIGSIYPLEVYSSYYLTAFDAYRFAYSGFLSSAIYNAYISINTDSSIRAASFYAYSDKRIKKNIVDIDDEKALSILRQIKPKTYDYVDKLQRGNNSVIGFIAQEIKEVLPKAVTIVKDYVPSFYTNCQVSATDASNIVLVTSPIDLSWNALHDQSGNVFVDADGNACSDASGNKVFNVKLYDESNNEITCKTTNVLDKRSFLMDVSGSKMVDSSGNLQLESDGTYFLHGQEVDDFHNLDKSAIFTVVTAAVQDIDRKQVLDEAKIVALEAQVASQDARIAALEQAIAALLAK